MNLIARKTIFLFVFIALFAASCSKTYQLTVIVKDYNSREPLDSVLITIPNSEPVFTDSNGEVVFSDLRDKRVSIEAVDSTKTHNERTVHDINRKREDKTVSIELDQFYQHRNLSEFFARDLNYPSSKDSTVLDPVANICDSTNMVEANFPGGIPGIKEFIQRNIQYPEISKELGDQGRVVVQFFIEKDGVVSHARVIRSVSNELDLESRYLVYSMPTWEPATCDGVPVRTRLVLPITFTLN